MPNLLLIETATEVCSVAIASEGKVIAQAENLTANRHTTVLADQIQQCCRAAKLALNQMDAVAISRGPGSYTSLRVGAATAKGICYALAIPLIAVDTLQALAIAAADGIPPGCGVLPMLDARRAEVWGGLYDQNGRELIPAQPIVFENNLYDSFVAKVTSFFNSERIVLAGNGAFKTKLVSFFERATISPQLHCSASSLLSMAELKLKYADFENVTYFEPFYIKNPNITISTRQII
ncbi:MAG: tRNA (adenosine(37)-N6)-threonylcarbamoyltransferase complex dimerization subunit type 1 TsaB [Saprospiraceae bacterium]|nr:tRNA (adenosine(37)-N6)-threonylcarbamoyltransferase complex dimerization subunit type 1 TsaB [Saprospiraceae bacterium]